MDFATAVASTADIALESVPVGPWYEAPLGFLVAIIGINLVVYLVKLAIRKNHGWTSSDWFPRVLSIMTGMGAPLVPAFFPEGTLGQRFALGVIAGAAAILTFHAKRKVVGKPGGGVAALLLVMLAGCSGSAISVVDGPSIDSASLSVDYDAPEGVMIDVAASTHVSLNVGNVVAVLVGSVTVADGYVFGHQALMVTVATWVGVGVSFEFDTSRDWAEFCVTLVIMQGKTPFVMCWPMEIGERNKPPEKIKRS